MTDRSSPPGRRILAIWLPTLAIDRWRLGEGLRRGEGADAQPFALLAETAHGPRLYHALIRKRKGARPLRRAGERCRAWRQAAAGEAARECLGDLGLALRHASLYTVPRSNGVPVRHACRLRGLNGETRPTR